jgi:hypothetical protein
MRPERAVQKFPKNAEGPFFVANGECIACMAPRHEAPDLMAFDEEANHCYFKKQPSTPEEFERAARAVQTSCCGAVQYSGNDPAVYRRIEELRKESAERARQRQNQQRHRWRFW